MPPSIGGIPSNANSESVCAIGPMHYSPRSVAPTLSRRRLDPEVRVLLMSGFNEQDAIHRFAGKGLAGFLQKPYKASALVELVKLVVTKRGEGAGAS